MANSKRSISPEEHLNCTICLEMFRCPRSLPCLHTFCESCLQSYINKSAEKNELKQGKFVCPVCRKPTEPRVDGGSTSSTSWAKLYPPNYALLSLLDSTHSQRAPVCESCAYRGLTKDAQKFCRNCREHLCIECVRYHQSLKVTRSHQLVMPDEVGHPGTTVTVDLDHYCQFHNQKSLKYFCKDDNSLCCSTCAIVNHRKCQDVVEVSTLASAVKQDKKPEKLGEALKEFRSYFQGVKEILETDAKEFEKQLQNIPTKIQEIRVKINNLLDRFEERITSESQSARKSASLKKEEQIDNYQRMELSIENAHAQLEYVLKHGNDTQIFITLLRAEEQVLKYEKEIRQSHEDVSGSTAELVIPHEINLLLESKMEGKLDIKNSILTLPQCLHYKLRKPLKDCPVVYLETVDALPSGESIVRFAGAACLPDGRILLATQYSMKVHVYDCTFTHKSSVSLDVSPWQVACLNEHQIAVCNLSGSNEIQLVAVDKASIFRKIRTKSASNCIAPVNKNTLAVVLDMENNPKFITISMDGTETSRFSQDKNGRKFETFRFMAISRDKRRILQSCYRTRALYCFTLDGTPCFTYKHPELKNPSGVDVDRDDNVYVCGLNSNNIHQLTPDGQLIRIIMEGGIMLPLKLCFFPNGTKFFVTETSGAKIRTFKIEDKP